MKLQFDVSNQCRFEIYEMYCGYSEDKTIKPINTINCFKDFFTYGTFYENDDEVYYSRVRFINMRNHELVEKLDVKYIFHGRDDRSKGLHYYKFDKDVYQIKTD